MGKHREKAIAFESQGQNHQSPAFANKIICRGKNQMPAENIAGIYFEII
jgi:hypothetical protein